MVSSFFLGEPLVQFFFFRERPILLVCTIFKKWEWVGEKIKCGRGLAEKNIGDRQNVPLRPSQDLKWKSLQCISPYLVIICLKTCDFQNWEGVSEKIKCRKGVCRKKIWEAKLSIPPPSGSQVEKPSVYITNYHCIL